MTAAGNDFILFEKRKFPVNSIPAEFAKAVCDRHFGIGADGIIIISESDNYDFEMEYYNSDGSGGSLCANGARAALRFAELNHLAENRKISFSANGVEYSGEIIDQTNVRFSLSEPLEIKTGIILQHNNHRIEGDFINTGSPHFVINVSGISDHAGKIIYNSPEEIQVGQLGKELRYRKEFEPGGANINFISNTGSLINIRTFERGVENETLACGTGAVAASISVFLNSRSKPPFKLITRGGEILNVDFDHSNHKFSSITLIGPAVLVFNGELESEKFINHIRSTNGKSDL